MQHPAVDVYARTLARAAAISGGPHELADKLHVTTRQLEAWMNGADRTPPTIFLQVVDLLLEAQLAALREAARR